MLCPRHWLTAYGCQDGFELAFKAFNPGPRYEQGEDLGGLGPFVRAFMALGEHVSPNNTEPAIWRSICLEVSQQQLGCLTPLLCVANTA